MHEEPSTRGTEYVRHQVRNAQEQVRQEARETKEHARQVRNKCTWDTRAGRVRGT